MSLPRTPRIFEPWTSRSSSPWSLIDPEMRAFLGSRSRIAIELTDLPDPDSPTIASTSPAWTS